MSNTELNVTSAPMSLAQSIAHKKTPIVVAIAEYVRSLMHNNPDTPYAFGEVKQGVREHVWWVLLPAGETTLTPAANDIPLLKEAA
jgi:hypothetical protein